MKTEEGVSVDFTDKIQLDPPSENTIPFEQLTESQVIEWVASKISTMRMEQIQGALNYKINAILHPTAATGLPWVKNSTSL